MSFIFVFVFGLIIGSFLNVLIERVPRGQSILGRSKCPNCGKKLDWQELLPVFSFLLLKGRCRACRRRISLSYPLVELATAFLFFLLFKNGYSPYWFLVASVFLVLIVTDIKYFILPDKIILFSLLSFVLFAAINFFNKKMLVCSFHNCSPLGIFLGALFFVGIFGPFYLFSKGEWIGLGDVKLGFLIGIIFGFYWSLNIFYLAVLFGSVAAVLVIAFGGGPKSRLPFGAFLGLAAITIILARLDFVGIILKF